VKNAATIMTKHFVDRLNMLSVFHSGHAVEYSVVHRKISYTNDYGFLSAEERKRLIDGDSFSINKHFVDGKTLLFIDDVRITGTHEHKLVELLDEAGIKLSTAHFLYHANLVSDTIHPDLKAKPEVLTKVDEFKQKIVGGSLVVPATLEELKTFKP
jgi:hypothetical protein